MSFNNIPSQKACSSCRKILLGEDIYFQIIPENKSERGSLLTEGKFRFFYCEECSFISVYDLYREIELDLIQTEEFMILLEEYLNQMKNS